MAEDRLKQFAMAAAATGAYDLSGPVPDLTPEGQAWGELHTQMRCGGCARRLGKVAFEVIFLEVLRHPLTGQRAVGRRSMVACGREDCDYVVQLVNRDPAPVAVSRIKDPYLFLDDERVRAFFGRPAEARADDQAEGSDDDGR